MKACGSKAHHSTINQINLYQEQQQQRMGTASDASSLSRDQRSSTSIVDENGQFSRNASVAAAHTLE